MHFDEGPIGSYLEGRVACYAAKHSRDESNHEALQTNASEPLRHSNREKKTLHCGLTDPGGKSSLHASLVAIEGKRFLEGQTSKFARAFGGEFNLKCIDFLRVNTVWDVWSAVRWHSL